MIITKHPGKKFLLFALAIVFASNAGAQEADVPQVVKDYVAAKGKKEKVPADVNKIVKGDLNGDKTEDLAVQYYVQIGYPGNATTVATAIFVNRKGKYVFAGETSDKVVPDSISNGILTANQYSDSELNKIVATYKYKLSGKRLIKTK